MSIKEKLAAHVRIVEENREKAEWWKGRKQIVELHLLLCRAGRFVEARTLLIVLQKGGMASGIDGDSPRKELLFNNIGIGMRCLNGHDSTIRYEDLIGKVG